jgi:hypothetical protein
VTPPAPARLSVILAAEAPVAVILRRGPSEWVRCIRWDTARDLFELGQWFRGGIGPASLSPNGEFMAYWGAKSWPPREPRAWTAISRPPYLTALAFWPYSFGWDAGGRFIDDRTFERTYWEENCPKENNEKPPPPRRLLKIVAAPRASRRQDSMPVLPDVVVDRHWVIRREWKRTKKSEQGKGLYHIRYMLTDNGHDTDVLATAEWAGVDHRKRLVFAASGRILAAARRMNGSLDVTILADLNDMTPDPEPSPAWAQSWTAPRRTRRSRDAAH